MSALLVIIAGYVIGSVPVAQLAARARRGVDLREVGSGNPGASNIWQSVDRWLTVPVGLAQIGQGLAAVLVARLLGAGEVGQASAGLAAVIANNWNPWLGLTGGRGIGQTIGVLLGISWPALGVFIIVAVVGVVVGWIPQFIALALFAAPFGEVAARGDRATALACLALATVAMCKRVLGNARPSPAGSEARVWLTRLVYDRDVRDRDAWVRRGLPRTGGGGPGRRDGGGA